MSNMILEFGLKDAALECGEVIADEFNRRGAMIVECAWPCPWS